MQIKMTRKRKLLFNFIVVGIISAGVVAVCSKFVHLGTIEYTDNAQVKQHITPVNTRVSGFIKEIRFSEYQHVNKGDTLVVIEDSEFRLRLAQAEADYQNATAGKAAMYTSISTTQNNVTVTDAAVEEIKIRLANAETELKRYAQLVSNGAATRQQYDRAETEYNATKARYEQLVRQRNSTELVKQEQTHRLGQNDAMIQVTEAALNLARLNLSYTVVIATADGVCGRLNIHEGQLVQPGQTLVDIVDDGEIWVIANYKETQTANIKVGMPVSIEVDAVPGVVYKGKVEAISQATGASYSLFSQDNSSGNFIKVEQRIPIRISFDKDNDVEDMSRLRSGLNVECEIDY